MKNTRKIALGIILILGLFNKSNAQEKYALFVHGIFSSAKEGWTDIGIPQQWVVDKIITDYATIDYDVDELVDTRDAVFQRAYQAIIEKKANAEWIIVGHSLGGMVSRGIYDYLKRNYPTINIKAITTLNSPMQGANIAHASYGSRPGHRNIEPILCDARGKLIRPLSFIPILTDSYVTTLVDLYDKISGKNACESFTGLPFVFDDIINSHAPFLANSNTNEYRSLMGRVDGYTDLSKSLIHFINHESTLKPENIRAINTAEKSKGVLRMAGDFYRNGDELGLFDKYDAIEKGYDIVYSYYDLLTEISKYTLSIYYTVNKRKRDHWKAGLNQLQGLDNTWAKIIDANEYIYSSTWMDFMIDDACDANDYTGNILRCIDGILYERRLVEVVTKIPTKTDAFLTIPSMTWNKGDNIDDREKNFHYSDVPADGGYNHLEVKRYKRAYTQPGVFNKGDYAPPMREAALWIRNGYPNN